MGYGLTTAEIVYRRPDRHWLLQSYVWQDYDMFPNFPALKGFLAFWEKSLDGPLFAVTVAHSKLKQYTAWRRHLLEPRRDVYGEAVRAIV